MEKMIKIAQVIEVLKGLTIEESFRILFDAMEEIKRTTKV